MESIAQILNFKKDIELISLNMFKIESELNVLSLLNPIPSKIISTLSNPELLDVAAKASEYINKLHDLLNGVNRELHKELYEQTQTSKPKDEPYAGFKVDEKPLTSAQVNKEVKQLSIFDYEEIKSQYELENKKPLKPVKRRSQLPYKGDCVFCNAPNDYLYNNNKGDQCLCKVCKNTFSYKTKFYNELSFYCPHCKNKLSTAHDRLNYTVYRCQNDDCSYYKESLKKQASGDKSLKTVSDREKLRYIYRAFKFDFNQVNSSNKLVFNTKISLDRAYHSPQTIGTILTLYINYGLSSRKVSSLMKDLFGIEISHQTVMNYAEASASLLQNLTTDYSYNLGNILCGDETYIKVLGKTKYVFFFSDPKSKVISSWKIYDHRDTKNAVESILMSINKYNKIPEDLLIITDANPIYNAAQIFLEMNNIKFNLQQVVGVSNKDEISVKYRPYKQIEERLNRTYKQNYYGTNGYQTLTSANVYMILYVTFFNFLRRHSSLDFNTPVELDELKEIPLMPDKWIKLINMSKSYIN